MTNETILSKVKKLLTLANDNGASESEAEVAMQKAHALLAEHNLSMSDIKETSNSKIVEKDYLEYETSIWRREVYHAAADLYFCDYFYQTGKITVNGKIKYAIQHTFIGTEENSLVAREMANYFINTIEKLSKPYKGSGKRFMTSFKRGASVRLRERVKNHIEKAKNGEAVVDGKNLPALLSLYEQSKSAIEQHLQDQGYIIKSNSSNTEVDPEAFILGAKAGETIGLHTQIENSEEQSTALLEGV